jgi:hypothetical protein
MNQPFSPPPTEGIASTSTSVPVSPLVASRDERTAPTPSLLVPNLPPGNLPTPNEQPAAPVVTATKGGEGGDRNPGVESPPRLRDCSTVTNAEFAAAIFWSVPEGATPAICTKTGDPETRGWSARRLDALDEHGTRRNNNYLNCGSFKEQPDGSVQARKDMVVAVHCLLLDDLGTKVPFEALGAFPLSWLVETSPGNHQGGLILESPLSLAEAEALHSAIVRKGLCDAGAGGPGTRWVRLPIGVNGKAKYLAADGSPFPCRLVAWHPERRFSAQEILAGLELEPVAGAVRSESVKPIATATRTLPERADSVFTPKPVENPVITALKAHGLYKRSNGPGKHDITCPWVKEHTDQLDNGAAYFEPDEEYPRGGFRCHHSHGDRYHIHDVLNRLCISDAEARHKPVIRVVAGEIPRVVDAAVRELTKLNRFYRSGGLIVTVSADSLTGDPSIVPVSKEALTTDLALAIRWERCDRRGKEWVPCDPPLRHVGLIFEGRDGRHLPPLLGLARQPYYREGFDELVMTNGYDPQSQLFAAFDPRRFVLGEPTVARARVALAMLEELLGEFHFVAPHDKAAALAAIFTAVLRPSLAAAPAFHVRAPVFGSGKTFLCDLIGCFAGPARNKKVSYPKTAEEATKMILALLLGAPAVIEFDDMDSDWIPHGVIKRMLTAEYISDRILGVSKAATVSTRTLFLGSGNNVGPVRDLLRRVLTIHLDPRCATPATLSYRGDPVGKVRGNREAYVAAVLTIIEAWRAAGSPRAAVSSIASYGGDWSDYCRHPLIWLGYSDPATVLLTQIRHDPDTEVLSVLMHAWWDAFGPAATTVRKAIEYAMSPCQVQDLPSLRDALHDCPIVDRCGSINPSKLGWFLRKNANRICDGYEFLEARADGRLAWRLVAVGEGPDTPTAQDSCAQGSDDAPLGEDDIPF